MNRITFKGLTTKKGSFLNDEIQWKLQEIFPQNMNIIMEQCSGDNRYISEVDRPREYHIAVANMEAIQLAFDNIVARGSDFAYKFIGE